MSKIRNRFEILLAEKQLRDERQYTYDDIYAATGISPNTLTAYVKQRVTRFDNRTVTALCDWLDCDLSELLEYPPESSQQNSGTRSLAAV